MFIRTTCERKALSYLCRFTPFRLFPLAFRFVFIWMVFVDDTLLCFLILLPLDMRQHEPSCTITPYQLRILHACTIYHHQPSFIEPSFGLTVVSRLKRASKGVELSLGFFLRFFFLKVTPRHFSFIRLSKTSIYVMFMIRYNTCSDRLCQISHFRTYGTRSCGSS